MKIKDFVKKHCKDCHRECVRKKDILECMRSYKDFLKHSNKHKLSEMGAVDFRLLIFVVVSLTVYIILVNLAYNYAIHYILSLSVGM